MDILSIAHFISQKSPKNELKFLDFLFKIALKEKVLDFF